MNGKMMIKPLRNLALSLIALAVLVVPSFGASFDLVAEEAVATMPDTTTIPMWGFFPDTGQACNPGTPPAWEVGEQLTVPAGDTSLTINLRNCLDSHPVSIVIPGQPAVLSPVSFTDGVITSYSIHYTKLYDQDCRLGPCPGKIPTWG